MLVCVHVYGSLLPSHVSVPGLRFVHVCVTNPLSVACCVLYPSSPHRHGGRAADPKHPLAHAETQLPVETRHEHLTGRPRAAGRPRQGTPTDSALQLNLSLIL